MEKIKFIGMTLSEVMEFFQSLDQPKYRAEQLFIWIYKKRITAFEEMTNFPKQFRTKLDEMATIQQLQLLQVKSSLKDETHKFLFQLDDGLCVESVFMVEGHRRTVCLSSQVGCSLNCSFCATGKMGFKRNLTAGEIVAQLLFIQSYLHTDVSNVVLMGMGEPFLNYEQAIKACDLISHDKGIAIGKRKITISTSGIVPAIKRFTDEGHRYKLAISLNAATDLLRNQIMPINTKYPIGEVISAARYYSNRSKQRLTFEYVLIAGVNDDPQQALKLKSILHDLRCKVNLIPYNEIDDTLRQAGEERINEFMKPFLDMNIVVSVRRSKGDDIEAACGQLYYDRLSK